MTQGDGQVVLRRRTADRTGCGRRVGGAGRRLEGGGRVVGELVERVEHADVELAVDDVLQQDAEAVAGCVERLVERVLDLRLAGVEDGDGSGGTCHDGFLLVSCGILGESRHDLRRQSITY